MLRSNERLEDNGYDVIAFYTCAFQVLKYLLCGRLCIRVYNLKDGSLRLQPPRTRCGGVRKNSAFSHLIRRLGPVKEVVA